ncbi:hypothetical protein P4123_25030 [Pseudomonas aeruginosa]|nr:hypothetical protein [Pseudomonas aeruginosa]
MVDGPHPELDKGEVLAIVGESDSGKSVTMMALMGLIDAPGWVSADHLRFSTATTCSPSRAASAGASSARTWRWSSKTR